MLRLSSLLPIIQVTPVQDREPGRGGYRQPGGEPAVSPDHTARPGVPQSLPQPVLERSSQSSLTSTASLARDPVQQDLAESQPDRQPTLSPAPAARPAKSASYGIVGLLNPELDEVRSPAGTYETRFSPTATLLASLRNGNPRSKDSGLIRSTAPLVREAPNHPAVLAVALRNAISQSGLFYESHLEQWLNGTRTLDVLRQEPQGNLPPELLLTPADIRNAANENTQPSLTQQPLAWLQQNLVQQLSILNNPTLIWTGQVWTGQHVTLQTSRDSSRCVESEAPWVTKLSLEMPHLGRIKVILTLDSSAVEIDIQSESAQGQAQMQAHQIGLGDRLSDAGCRLRRFSVRRSDGQA